MKFDRPPPEKKSQQYNQWAVAIRSAARAVPLSREDRETNLSVRSLIVICDYLVVSLSVCLFSVCFSDLSSSFVTCGKSVCVSFCLSVFQISHCHL